MIKAIIFDFDGVIHDTFELCYDTAKELKLKLSREDYKELFKGNIFKKYYKEKHNDRKTTSKFYEIQNKKFEGLKVERHIWEEIKKIHEEFKTLFILSSNSEFTIGRYFEDNNLHEFFKDILAYETHTSKQIKFDMILKNNNLNKEEVIFITDTLGDIREANEAGIQTIAVDFGFHDKETLEKGNPYAIVSDFKDILPKIKELTL